MAVSTAVALHLPAREDLGKDEAIGRVVIDDEDPEVAQVVRGRGDRLDSVATIPNRATKWNWLPLPGSLSSHMRPSIISTSCVEMVRPRPVPPYRRVVDASACTNAPKISHCFSSGMPMPVSRTVKRRRTSSVPRSSTDDVDADFAFVRELDRVAHEIEDDLSKPPGVAEEAVGHVGSDPAGEVQALLIGARRQQLDAVFDRIAEAERRAIERQPARLDLRDVQDVVDDRHQRFGRFARRR